MKIGNTVKRLNYVTVQAIKGVTIGNNKEGGEMKRESKSFGYVDVFSIVTV